MSKKFKIKHNPKIYFKYVYLGTDISVVKLFLKSEGIGNTALGSGYSCREAGGAGWGNPQVALTALVTSGVQPRWLECRCLSNDFIT